MFKRFIRNNKALVLVILATLVLCVFLMTVVAIKYSEMTKYIAQISEMRETISGLLDTKRNNVAAVEDNIDLIKKDGVFYEGKSTEIHRFFGQPYRAGLDAMAQVLGLADGDALHKDFQAFLDENTKETPFNRYQRYKFDRRDKWDAATEAFRKNAQGASFEEITGANVDEIILFAIGVPRQMLGRSTLCADVLNSAKQNMFKHIADQKIPIGQSAAKFTLDNLPIHSAAAIGEAMRNMEIVGDIVKRIASSEVKISSLEDIAIIPRGEDSKYPDYIRYGYQLQVTGSLASIRSLIKNLNESFRDNRIYIVRNLVIKCVAGGDEGAKIVGIEETQAVAAVKSDNSSSQRGNSNMPNMPGMGPGTGPEEQKPKVIIVTRDESNLPYNERSTYGQPVLGKNDLFNATIDIDYVVYRQKK